VVWHAVEEVKLAHPGREVLLKADPLPESEWDADRISQVVTNLVSNALKYSPPASPVDIQLSRTAATILLTVHNTGEPIPADLLPQLFEPLHRGGRGVDKTSRSIGLGLYIVNQIVRAHGGQASAQSTAESGTIFTVQLPLEA